MKTTIYINTILLANLIDAAEAADISKNELISKLLMTVIKRCAFKPEPFKAVRYQKSDPDIVWKREHIGLEPVFYEKALDLRRNFKFSVSRIIAYAIVNYLDEIVEELKKTGQSENMEDNYHRNFIYIYKKLDGIHHFISIFGFPGPEQLRKYL